jgi:cytochrome c oxidase subunit 2
MYGTGMESPTGVWWKPVHKNEKIWIWLAFGWCMVLFAMMPLWHLFGGQNPAGIRHRVDPADFRDRTDEFIETYQVGTENGIPVVEPPPGSHVYLLGQMWQWRPVLRLQEGAEYTLHLSSVDVNHGFNLYPFNVNFQVVPGYDYGLEIVPTQAGEFGVVCNEFCGYGHHLMVGRVYVLTAEEMAADRAAREAAQVAEATPSGAADPGGER